MSQQRDRPAGSQYSTVQYLVGVGEVRGDRFERPQKEVAEWNGVTVGDTKH